MRHRNRFHSNTLVFCSVQLFFFLSFARHVAKNIESINRDQRKWTPHLHPSLWKKVFICSVHVSHHLISNCSVFRWDRRLWKDSLEVFQNKGPLSAGGLIHGAASPGSGGVRATWISWDKSISGVAGPSQRTKQVALSSEFRCDRSLWSPRVVKFRQMGNNPVSSCAES